MLDPAHRARVVAPIVLAMLLLVAPAGRAVGAPACDPDGADATAVTSARAAVQSACSCTAAASIAAWRRCVRDALATLDASALSAACSRLVLRTETRSTCGRTARVVCCRTNAAGRTLARLRRQGHCLAPRGGSACVAASPFLADACVVGGCAPVPQCGDGVVDPGEECDPPDGVTCSSTCTVCPPEADGCPVATTCGDGVLDPGEGCDPPDGVTCSSACTSCAPQAPGELLIACTAGATPVEASVLADTFLVAFTDLAPGDVRHVAARRLASDGAFVDAAPLRVSAPLPATAAAGGSVEASASSDTGFYVAWSTYGSFQEFLAVRPVPPSGALASNPSVLAANLPFGYCHVSIAGPLGLAPALAPGPFHATWRVLYGCGSDVLLETLAGVGNYFSVPPPGNISSGPAPIVRGASDVAAVWWNELVSSVQPLLVDQFLAAGWVEPAPQSMILLSHGFSPVAPALAAVGDTFVAAWASGDELRAMRFTRAGGALDPDGGLLLASGGGTIDDVAAAANGSTVLIAWRAVTGPGQSAVRVIHLAPDGSTPDPAPIAVATATGTGAVAVAANPSAALVAFTRGEAVGSSVRGVLLGP